MTIIEQEAVIVREVYARCLEGASPGETARELNDRGKVTVSGKLWQPYAVRSVLASRHVTGIRVFRGQEAGEGTGSRSSTGAPGPRSRSGVRTGPRRMTGGGGGFIWLRGLVVCKNCGWRMAGSTSKDASYMCAKHTYLGLERCHRRIGAARLEEFVNDAAVDLLTHLDVTGTPSAATGLAPAEQAAISTDEAELAELTGVSDESGAPTRTCRRNRRISRNVST